MRYIFRALALSLLLLMQPLSVKAAFSDVSSGHPHRAAIDSLQERGIVGGYSDGTFHPEGTINRAEFVKIVGGSLFSADELASCLDRFGMPLFDVDVHSWYAPYVCRALVRGIVSGYPDESFRPENPVSFVEAAKIITKTFDIPTMESDPWYKSAVIALGERDAIPESIATLDQQISRGEMAEMVWRILDDVRDRPTRSVDALLFTSCEPVDEKELPGVDRERFRETWLHWINTERRANGLPEYVLHPQLNRSASRWSDYSVQIGEMTHKRPGQEEYYNYDILTDWFLDLGLEFLWSNGYVHTENIGRGHVVCEEDDDCTHEFIEASRHTFELYMEEKTQDVKPHYSSMVNPEFRMIGIGISLDATDNISYLTIHYATEIISDPPELCVGD